MRELGDEVQSLFTQVLLTCERLGLIGREMFAIDGVKLPCNASKERSGSQHPIIVAAEVTGSGSEQAMLLPMVKACAEVRGQGTLITADAGYHSTENLQALAENRASMR